MSRRQYLDWARGIAVLLMIQTHALDSWTALAHRATSAYRILIFVGGLAAPLFLFLAGAALALGAERRLALGESPSLRDMVRRGLQIFGLAFLFRLQALVVSPGGPLVDFLRVDILNVMGLSLAAAGLLWFLGSRTGSRPVVFAMAGAATALAAPSIRTAPWVDALPAVFQWYVRPSGDHTVFTLFPWAGFVFGGAAWGSWSVRDTPLGDGFRRHLWTMAGGVGLIALGIYAPSWPDIYGTPASGGSAPAFFALRVGVVGVTLAALFLASSRAPVASSSWVRPLERLGRGSLFVYWIHVELVYGYASWAIHQRLSLAATMLAVVALAGLMYGGLRLRDTYAKDRRREHPQVVVQT